MTHDQIRAEFEAWYNKEAERNEFGQYKNPWTEARWVTWQAAKSSAWRPISEAPHHSMLNIIHKGELFASQYIISLGFCNNEGCFEWHTNKSLQDPRFYFQVPDGRSKVGEILTPPAKQEK